MKSIGRAKNVSCRRKRSLKFQACKPSAHYQLPLVSGCMGACEYCYLNTQLGNKPYVRIFVNSDEILNQAQSYINKRIPDTKIFEGSAYSDPFPLEPYTGLLKKSIEFFGSQRNAKFRFVTKYNNINSLLYANHNQNTQIRFSLNTSKIIKEYEHFTATVSSRIAAAAKLLEQGYPIGFIIAPVFLYDNWKKDYKDLIQMLHSTLPKNIKLPISFEIISHRYTTKAKNIINQVFPETTLPMTDTERTYKYGQFGYGKFVYTKAQLNEIKDFSQPSLTYSIIKILNILYNSP